MTRIMQTCILLALFCLMSGISARTHQQTLGYLRSPACCLCTKKTSKASFCGHDFTSKKTKEQNDVDCEKYCAGIGQEMHKSLKGMPWLVPPHTHTHRPWWCNTYARAHPHDPVVVPQWCLNTAIHHSSEYQTDSSCDDKKKGNNGIQHLHIPSMSSQDRLDLTDAPKPSQKKMTGIQHLHIPPMSSQDDPPKLKGNNGIQHLHIPSMSSKDKLDLH